ncbi:MAG: sugar ABC transporter substrate-binding protein [Lachnospiraceae bacterium]|nr:sugar ABC transporter substrate-binding protein [Lachnospiraceae bacterium]
MKRTRRWLTLILAGAILSGLMACGSKTEQPATESPAPAEAEKDTGKETEQPAESKGMKVGFLNYTDANDTPRKFHEGIEDWCKANNAELLYVEAKGDAEGMMEACDNFILQGVDIVIDSNWNLAGGSSLVQKCNDAGIPLISLDTYYEGENSYYVGIDNNEAGALAGEAAAKYIKKKFEGNVDYLVVSYSAALEGINVRTTNSLQGIRDAGIDLADESYFELECGTGDATQTAKQQLTDWLTAHPTGKVAVVAGNDEMSLGFQAAIESQNRGEDCIIISNGCDASSQTNIAAGNEVWVAAVDYMAYNYAETAMPLAEKLVAGERPEEVMNYVAIRYIDGDNFAEFYGE